MTTIAYLIVSVQTIVYIVGAFKFPTLADEHFRASSRARSTFRESGPQSDNITLHKIIQHVDNFDVQNNATFEQQYFIKKSYYSGNGPIYLIISNQHLYLDRFELDEYLISSVARSERGLIAMIEPRFFGDSVPMEYVTLTISVSYRMNLLLD